MYKIKEFAMRSGVSIDTLKYYDRIGLFKPAHIDKNSLYRYYDATQLQDIYKIIVLKQSQFTTKEIKIIMSQSFETSDLIKIIEQKAISIDFNLKKQKEQLNQIYTNLTLLKNGVVSLLPEVIIKEVNSMDVVYKRAKICQQTFDELCENLWSSVEEYITINHLKKTIPCMSLYYAGFYVNTNQPIDIEVAIPVISFNNIEDQQYIRTLPKVKVASIIHQGAFEKIGDTYEILLKWLKAHEYTINGPVREIYHQGEWLTKNQNEYMTEIQVILS